MYTVVHVKVYICIPICTEWSFFRLYKAIFSGIGKGLVGTVTKPVAGLFDLASGTTAAIRESTSRVSRQQPPTLRHRRCCSSPSGSLTCYSATLAMGQEYLFRLNDGNLDEK